MFYIIPQNRYVLLGGTWGMIGGITKEFDEILNGIIKETTQSCMISHSQYVLLRDI